MLTIGRLADAAGLEAKTLRYYDRVGLLPPMTRTPAGYRLYGEDAVQRLEFIRRAKALGIALADIQRILAVRDEGAAPCAHPGVGHAKSRRRRIADRPPAGSAARPARPAGPAATADSTPAGGG